MQTQFIASFADIAVQFQTTAIEHHNKATHNLFAGGGSYLRFVKKKKKATPVKYIKTEHSKKRGMPIVNK